MSRTYQFILSLLDKEGDEIQLLKRGGVWNEMKITKEK
jgi:hypothetical protein